MSDTTRNYHAHGGNEWVIGGKLIFLPGAVVEGAGGLFDLPSAELLTAEPLQASEVPYLPNSEATTVSQLREHFNRLLAAMREAGVMAAEHVEGAGQGADAGTAGQDSTLGTQVQDGAS